MAYCTTLCIGSVLFDQNNKGLRIERHVERSEVGGHTCVIVSEWGGGGSGMVLLYRPPPQSPPLQTIQNN